MESGSGIKEKGLGSRERSRDHWGKTSTGRGRASHMGSRVGEQSKPHGVQSVHCPSGNGDKPCPQGVEHR